VEGALVAVDPRNGAIRSLVGGFDFDKNKFNHATQAWRQPGSSFKPFIYSAALEKGFTPATVINDAPLFFDAGFTGGKPWEPKNYDGKFDGPMTMRSALARSKNMVSIRILQAVGARNGQEWATRFGFEADKHPPFLTMALGAGEVTPLNLASAYAMFANGGKRITPWHLLKVTDKDGRVLENFAAPAATPMIDPRNAFVMANMMQDVIRRGTATSAMSLGRMDLSGKTGTTNDHRDTWFAGFQATRVAVAWMGYDQPRPLGGSETGGVTALPMWVQYMGEVLKNVPEMPLAPPPGVVVHTIDPTTGNTATGGQGIAEYFYQEFAPGALPLPGSTGSSQDGQTLF